MTISISKSNLYTQAQRFSPGSAAEDNSQGYSIETLQRIALFAEDDIGVALLTITAQNGRTGQVYVPLADVEGAVHRLGSHRGAGPARLQVDYKDVPVPSLKVGA